MLIWQCFSNQYVSKLTNERCRASKVYGTIIFCFAAQLFRIFFGKPFNQYLYCFSDHDISFGIGPAGTGKTYLAVACAVAALEQDRARRIVLGILFVTGVISAEEGAAEIDRVAGIVIGWAVIIFFGGLFVFAIISNLKSGKGPVIQIDEQGFFDRRVCIKAIPWSEIRGAHIFRGKSLYATPLRFISLDVIDPDLYLKKGIDRYFPRLFKLFKKTL